MARSTILAMLSVVTTVLLALTPRAQAQDYNPETFGYLCDDQYLEPGGWPGDCCQNTTPNPCDGPAPAATSQPNIVLLVSDDQAYCQYGFMAGLCSENADKDCWNEQDCISIGAGRCVSSVGKGLCPGGLRVCQLNADCPGNGTCNFEDANRKLRLADPACRNRQPKSDAECTGDASGFQHKNFFFSRGDVPCAGTAALRS